MCGGSGGTGGVCVHLCSDGWISGDALEKHPVTGNPLSWESRRTLVPAGNLAGQGSILSQKYSE